MPLIDLAKQIPLEESNYIFNVTNPDGSITPTLFTGVTFLSCINIFDPFIKVERFENNGSIDVDGSAT